MSLIDAVWFNHIFEGRFEQAEDLVRMKLFVLVIGHCFGCIAHSLAHFRRKVQAKLCLQYIAYAALSGLAVDTDNICVVVSPTSVGSIGRYGTVQCSRSPFSLQCIPFAMAS